MQQSSDDGDEDDRNFSDVAVALAVTISADVSVAVFDHSLGIG